MRFGSEKQVGHCGLHAEVRGPLLLGADAGTTFTIHLPVS
jgi:hypothetical protein